MRKYLKELSWNICKYWYRNYVPIDITKVKRGARVIYPDKLLGRYRRFKVGNIQVKEKRIELFRKKGHQFYMGPGLLRIKPKEL